MSCADISLRSEASLAVVLTAFVLWAMTVREAVDIIRFSRLDPIVASCKRIVVNAVKAARCYKRGRTCDEWLLLAKWFNVDISMPSESKTIDQAIVTLIECTLFNYRRSMSPSNRKHV